MIEYLLNYNSFINLVFDFDKEDDTSKLAPNKPPLNVVCIGAAKDEQTAKQTVLGGKESGKNFVIINLFFLLYFYKIRCFHL